MERKSVEEVIRHVPTTIIETKAQLSCRADGEEERLRAIATQTPRRCVCRTWRRGCFPRLEDNGPGCEHTGEIEEEEAAEELSDESRLEDEETNSSCRRTTQRQRFL